jgi:hypothetical protein
MRLILAVAGEADEVSEAGGQVQLPCRSRGWQPAVAGVLVAAAQTCTVPDPTKPPSCERVVCGQVHQDGPFYYEHLEALGPLPPAHVASGLSRLGET